MLSRRGESRETRKRNHYRDALLPPFSRPYRGIFLHVRAIVDDEVCKFFARPIVCGASSIT